MSKKIVLVTGATAGIGRDTALRLARAGHTVFATGRNEVRLAELREQAGDLKLDAFALDVTDDNAIAAARQRVLKATGGHGLDVLVNNAGWGVLAPMSETSDAQLRGQFETNVFGLMAMVRAFLPEMQERRAGRVVNVGSVGGRITLPMMGSYNATKYAVESLSDAMRVELGALGIDVVIIEPGPIKTEFTGRAVDASEASGPWASVVSDYHRTAQLVDRFAPGPEVVAAGIQRAVEARWPRARYVLPGYNLLFIALVKSLPAWVTDFVLRQSVGIRSGRIGREEQVLAA